MVNVRKGEAMSEDEEFVTKDFTEEELSMTEDEYVRCMGRMALDIMKMSSLGLSHEVSLVLGQLRHDSTIRYHVDILNVNGVDAVCILLHISEGRTAIFPMVNHNFTVKTIDGEDLTLAAKMMNMPKNKLN